MPYLHHPQVPKTPSKFVQHLRLEEARLGQGLINRLWGKPAISCADRWCNKGGRFDLFLISSSFDGNWPFHARPADVINFILNRHVDTGSRPPPFGSHRPIGYRVLLGDRRVIKYLRPLRVAGLQMDRLILDLP